MFSSISVWFLNNIQDRSLLIFTEKVIIYLIFCLNNYYFPISFFNWLVYGKQECRERYQVNIVCAFFLRVWGRKSKSVCLHFIGLPCTNESNLHSCFEPFFKLISLSMIRIFFILKGAMLEMDRWG